MYVYTNRYTNISFQDVFMGFQEIHSWTTLVDFLIINHAILVPGVSVCTPKSPIKFLSNSSSSVLV